MDISKFKHFNISDRIIEHIQTSTRNTDSHYFRTLVNYHLCKIASMMWCKLDFPGRGPIPVNMYAINLAVSGYGKGFSNNIMEEHVTKEFREIFINDVYEELAQENLSKIAVERAIRKDTDDERELAKVEAEFDRLGPILFSFDSGTAPALKQMRQRILMAGCGSMNLEIDEIGSNFIGNTEILNSYLELYDVGRIKQKLIKNTQENQRSEEIDGRTPTNLMLYGTPVRLLDSAKTEQEFWSMVSSGYGRRCFYCYSPDKGSVQRLSPKEMLKQAKSTSNQTFLQDLSEHLATLAHPDYFNTTLEVSDDVALILFEYQVWCEERAEEFNQYQTIPEAEMTHRYFKAAKLAAAYAFVEGETEVQEYHMEAAILYTEESGEHFKSMYDREEPFVQFARYVADIGRELTFPELAGALPFFKGSQSQRKEMIEYAIAWGYKNSIIIQKIWREGIEFIKGESLKPTDLEELIVSTSDDKTYDYEAVLVEWEDLEEMGHVDDKHWTTHAYKKGHRSDENAIPGTNLLVLDIDDGTTLENAQELMKDYQYIIYTTKRHTPQHHRFRMILPLSHEIHMDGEEYKEFCSNVFDWIPFQVDDKTGQRGRKWLTNDGDVYTNKGKLIDVFPFIPRTTRCEEQQKRIAEVGDLSNLERWFVLNTGQGNRNERLLRFALMLVDSGYDSQQIMERVFALNGKIANGLKESEIRNTIMQTVNSKIGSK